MKLSRVHPFEWLASITGAILVVGLFLPWAGGSIALDPPGPLDILLLLAGIGGVITPWLVAFSDRTNAPVAFQTLLWTVSLLLLFILAIKAVIPHDDGWDTGFWVVFAGNFTMAFFLWRSVARRG